MVGTKSRVASECPIVAVSGRSALGGHRRNLPFDQNARRKADTI